jgi:hypothetical protein
MARVFISYRRADSAEASERLYQALSAKFGRANVIKDTDDIPAGADFAAYIARRLAECLVALVVIGPGWLEARDAGGGRRLDAPEDYVRLEVETALRLGLTVVPVLVGGAAMPAAAALPTSLRELPTRNALVVREQPDFARDMERVFAAVDPARARRRRAAGKRALLVGLATVVVMTSVGVLSARLGNTAKPNTTQTASALRTSQAAGAQTAAAVTSTAFGLAQRVDYPYHAPAPGPGCDKGNAPWQLASTNPKDLTCFADHTHWSVTTTADCTSHTGHCLAGGSILWTPTQLSGPLPDQFTASLTFANLTENGLTGLDIVTSTTAVASWVITAQGSDIAFGESAQSKFFKSVDVSLSTPHTIGLAFDGTHITFLLDGNALGTVSLSSAEMAQRIDLNYEGGGSPLDTEQGDLSNFSIA